jgi:membrane protein YqaA with SNARE-associated domain
VLERTWRPAAGLAIAIAISVLVFQLSDRVEQFGRYGYPGVFAISLLGNATLILPAPSLAIVSVVGSVLNPYLVGLFAGAGSALGELTGYLAGYSGQAVIPDTERYDRIVAWMRRHGLWVIFVLSVIPNPLFDLAGIAAGALRFPLHHFLLVCWLGKTVKTTTFALGGSALLASLLNR